jgi:hypothetical protein
MSEREQDGRYHHDPREGETSYPPGEGEQHGPHRPDERDPHEPANTGLDELPEAAPGQAPRHEGMGGKPPARGERISREPMPSADQERRSP